VAIVSFVLVAVGLGLIIIGTVISVLEWNKLHKPKPKGEVVTEPTSALEGLAKLADALKGHPLGMQLIIAGIGVLVIAGVFGGVAQL
jgi:hypothetical protein